MLSKLPSCQITLQCCCMLLNMAAWLNRIRTGRTVYYHWVLLSQLGLTKLKSLNNKIMLRCSLEQRTINVICKYNRPFFTVPWRQEAACRCRVLLIKFIGFSFIWRRRFFPVTCTRSAPWLFLTQIEQNLHQYQVKLDFFLPKWLLWKKGLPLLFFLVFAFVKLIVS